jgi:hypothetical protein
MKLDKDIIMITELKFDIKNLTPPQQVIDRMKCRFANYPIMSDKEYTWLIYETEITLIEHTLIHAMQSSIGLDILESKLTNQNYLWLKDSYRWIDSWKPYTDYDDAKKHLEKVDRYYMHKYNKHYELWFVDPNFENPIALLDWSEVMVDRALQKYGERTKAKRRSSVLDGYV